MNQRARPEIAAWLLAALAVLPLLSVFVVHLAARDGAGTGFLLGDQATYIAQGREFFEGGHFPVSPNAYDADPQRPAIYFNLFWLLMGALILGLRLDPGLGYFAFTVVAALVMSRLTLAVVRDSLPTPRHVVPLFLATMWGGGLVAALALASNALTGAPLLHDLMRHEPNNGLWLLPWGRNVIFGSEATYHALLLGIWLGLLRRRWWLALLLLVLLTAAHAFTGAQALLLVASWCALAHALHLDDRPPLGFIAAAAAVAVLFFGYWFVYLDRFPAHRALMQVQYQVWTVSVAALVLSNALVALPAGWRARALARDRTGQWRNSRLLLAATLFAVSALLANHELFLPRVMQPAHFTHGYLWLPLWLIGLPVVQGWLDRLEHLRRPLRGAVLAVALGLFSVDNMAFVVQFRTYAALAGCYADRDLRALFAWAQASGLRGVLLTTAPETGELAAAYTGLTPFCCNLYWTPHLNDRLQILSRWNAAGCPSPRQIDFILLPDDQCQPALNGAGWILRRQSGEWRLLERPSADPR